MQERKALQHMAAIAALAMMFGAGSAYSQQSGMDSSGKTGTGSAGPMSGSSAAGASGGASSAGSLSKADQDMLKQLASANMSEIEAGKIALDKSKNEQVRNFAQKMVDDHTKAQTQLNQLAQAKGVSLPSEPDARHRKELDTLRSLSGAQFDKTYLLRGGVADHRQAHAMLTHIEKNAKDTDLKSLASNMMPTINEHAQMARQARAGGAPASTGASGTAGESAAGSSRMGTPSGSPGMSGPGASDSSSGGQSK